MGWRRKQEEFEGTDSNRDMVGQNPTGRARRSSAGQRRKADRRLDRDLRGSKWE